MMKWNGGKGMMKRDIGKFLEASFWLKKEPPRTHLGTLLSHIFCLCWIFFFVTVFFFSQLSFFLSLFFFSLCLPLVLFVDVEDPTSCQVGHNHTTSSALLGYNQLSCLPTFVLFCHPPHPSIHSSPHSFCFLLLMPLIWTLIWRLLAGSSWPHPWINVCLSQSRIQADFRTQTHLSD